MSFTKSRLERWTIRFPWRKLFIIAGSVIALVIFVSVGFWIHEKNQARPLYGDFDLELRCAGGHEIFLRLEESAAYNNCPGHKDKALIGRIERTPEAVLVHRKKDDAPWMRITWDGKQHHLEFLQRRNSSTLEGMTPVRGVLAQVLNPFRTILPRYLPED